MHHFHDHHFFIFTKAIIYFNLRDQFFIFGTSIASFSEPHISHFFSKFSVSINFVRGRNGSTSLSKIIVTVHQINDFFRTFNNQYPQNSELKPTMRNIIIINFRLSLIRYIIRITYNRKIQNQNVHILKPEMMVPNIGKSSLTVGNCKNMTVKFNLRNIGPPLKRVVYFNGLHWHKGIKKRRFGAMVYHLKITCLNSENPKHIDIEPIYFFNRMLNEAETKYWPRKLEMVSLIWVIRKTRHLIETAKETTVIFTDHAINTFITRQTIFVTSWVRTRRTRGSQWRQSLVQLFIR